MSMADRKETSFDLLEQFRFYQRRGPSKEDMGLVVSVGVVHLDEQLRSKAAVSGFGKKLKRVHQHRNGSVDSVRYSAGAT